VWVKITETGENHQKMLDWDDNAGKIGSWWIKSLIARQSAKAASA
jgi:hypothetical protein